MKLSVIIPVHNEGKNLTTALDKISSFLNRKRYDYEILVSEDGSTDNTLEIAREFSRTNNKVRVLHSAKRLGKGGGIMRGFRESKGDIIVFIDADLSSGPAEMEKVIQAVRKGNDLAIASRNLKRSRIIKNRPLMRRIAARGMNVIVNSMFGLSVSDSQCGLKAISKSALDKILPNLESKGFEFDVDLILKARQSGLKIREVPITWEHKQETSKISSLPMREIKNIGSGIMNLWVKNYFDKLDLLFIAFLLLFSSFGLAIAGKTIDPDEGTHMAISAFYYNFIHDIWRHPTFSFTKIYDYAIYYLIRYPKLSLYYPPGFYVTASFVSSIVGLSSTVLASVGLLFGVLTSIAIYFFGRRFVGKNAAILSSVLFMIIPAVFYLSVRAMLDIPYFLFFLLSLISYLVAFKSGKMKHFFLAGILLSIGFLFKENIAILVPIVFLYGLLAERQHLKKVVISFVVAGIIISPFAIFLYKSGLLLVLLKSSLRTTGFDLNIPQFNTYQGWIFYLSQLSGLGLGYPVLIAGLISLGYYCYKKERYWKLFLIWFVTTYIIFTIIPNKQGRYLLPAVPALLFPLSFYVSKFPRRLSTIIVVLIGVTFLASSFFILPPVFFYNTDYSSIASTVLNKTGNVLLLDEQQPWFYSSAFSFEMMRQDLSKSHSVIRPCILATLDTSNYTGFLESQGVRYVISPESNSPSLSQLGSLHLLKTFETKNATISVFENLDFRPQNETCNYICITGQWLCTKYQNPVDALR